MKKILLCSYFLCTFYVFAQDMPKFQDLFDAKLSKGVSCYRIPALTKATNGDLLAAIDERVTSCNDLRDNTDINIVMRRSTDNGKTWSAIERIADFPIGKSASDPSFIVDEETKEVFLFYNYMDLENEEGIYRLHVIRSSDHGQSWSTPLDITSQISKKEWHRDFKFITSGRGIQTRDGRLLHTLVNLDKGLYVFGSDNHGTSFFLMDVPLNPGDESKIVELVGGELMVNSRVNGSGVRFQHLSTDNGRTWESKSLMELSDPGCNASIIRYTTKADGYKKNRLLFANANNEKERVNLTVRISYDEGKTWNEGKTIYGGSSAYSSLCVLEGGSIGIFFEKDDYSENVFTRISLDWLTNGQDIYTKPIP